jgi:hypothetical protein
MSKNESCVYSHILFSSFKNSFVHYSTQPFFFFNQLRTVPQHTVLADTFLMCPTTVGCVFV